MNTEALFRRFHDRAGSDYEGKTDADSLIGFFQTFRPDGSGITDLYGDLAEGDALHDRLNCLFQATGDDRRPSGGRDAYFVIRNPPALDPELAQQLGLSWIEGLRDLAVTLGDSAIADVLSPTPKIRVLEGLPPKNPKGEERSRLLCALVDDASELVLRIDAAPYAPMLRPAYYYIACDSMLRDYLMWPLYAGPSGVTDPLKPYFELWRHGVKYRIFGDSQIDLYLPRQQI